MSFQRAVLLFVCLFKNKCYQLNEPQFPKLIICFARQEIKDRLSRIVPHVVIELRSPTPQPNQKSNLRDGMMCHCLAWVCAIVADGCGIFWTKPNSAPEQYCKSPGRKVVKTNGGKLCVIVNSVWYCLHLVSRRKQIGTGRKRAQPPFVCTCIQKITVKCLQIGRTTIVRNGRNGINIMKTFVVQMRQIVFVSRSASAHTQRCGVSLWHIHTCMRCLCCLCCACCVRERYSTNRQRPNNRKEDRSRARYC